MNDERSRKGLNFLAALKSLEAFVGEANPLSELDVAGVLKGFEFTFETCWKFLKFQLGEEGLEATSPRTTLKAAFAQGWLGDESVWIQMLEHRNLAVHTYNRALANEIYNAVCRSYLPAFQTLSKKRLYSVP